jgi:hypothetical protein
MFVIQYIEVGKGGGTIRVGLEGELGRCCYITVDLATAASQNGFSTYSTSFFFLRKSILFRTVVKQMSI